MFCLYLIGKYKYLSVKNADKWLKDLLKIIKETT